MQTDRISTDLLLRAGWKICIQQVINIPNYPISDVKKPLQIQYNVNSNTSHFSFSAAF